MGFTNSILYLTTRDDKEFYFSPQGFVVARSTPFRPRAYGDPAGTQYAIRTCLTLHVSISNSKIHSVCAKLPTGEESTPPRPLICTDSADEASVSPAMLFIKTKHNIINPTKYKNTNFDAVALLAARKICKSDILLLTLQAKQYSGN